MIQLLGLLALDSLIDFRGRQPPDLVSHVLDFGPGEITGRPRRAILFLADQFGQFIHFCQHRWRPTIPASFDFRCHVSSFLD
jgi:hypothetical protein